MARLFSARRLWDGAMPRAQDEPRGAFGRCPSRFKLGMAPLRIVQGNYARVDEEGRYATL